MDICSVYVSGRPMFVEENVSIKFVGEILEICPSLQTQVNGKGDTPLHVAAKFGHFNIANVFMKRAKLAQHEDEELESGLGAARQMIRMTNEKKNTALQSARGKPDYPYSANNCGKMPLHMAADYERFSHKMLAFLENCTSMSHEGPYGRTALRAAVMQLDFHPKMTALHLAMGRGHGRTVERILSLAPECYELVDNRGWNFFHYAI
ncbi:hypothetical protein CICLE_v10006842mg, partial [Citrus x clementina]